MPDREGSTASRHVKVALGNRETKFTGLLRFVVSGRPSREVGLLRELLPSMERIGRFQRGLPVGVEELALARCAGRRAGPPFGPLRSAASRLPEAARCCGSESRPVDTDRGHEPAPLIPRAARGAAATARSSRSRGRGARRARTASPCRRRSRCSPQPGRRSWDAAPLRSMPAWPGRKAPLAEWWGG